MSNTATHTYEYDAFGNQKNQVASDTNPFRYCGEFFDAETGSYYLRARYYDSTLGRFTQQDPHWNTENMVYGDEPISMSRGLLRDAAYYLPSILAMRQSGNLYVYAANDPIRYADPSGEGVILAFLVSTAGRLTVSTIVGGIATGLAYHSDGKTFSAGFINGATSGFVGGLAPAFNLCVVATVALSAFGNIAGTTVEGILSGHPTSMASNDENAIYFNAVVSGMLSGAVSSYLGYMFSDSFVMKEINHLYTDFDGELIQYFLNACITGISAKENP